MCCTLALRYTTLPFTPLSSLIASSEDARVCTRVHTCRAASFFDAGYAGVLSLPPGGQATPRPPPELAATEKCATWRERHWAFQVSLLDPGCPFGGNGPEPRPSRLFPSCDYFPAQSPAPLARKCKGAATSSRRNKKHCLAHNKGMQVRSPRQPLLGSVR
jgi:hypothetical protein